MLRILGSRYSAQTPQWKLYPTTLRLPVWARPVSVRSGLTTLRISDISVRRISSVFNRDRLLPSLLRPDLPKVLRPSDLLQFVTSFAPIDGVEIVEWMQISAAENLVMNARIREYNRAGSQILGNSGDPYTPGVTVDDSHIRPDRGRVVEERGYGIVETPRGNFQFPVSRGRPGIFRDLIEWASNTYLGKLQWVGNLLKWRELAETPIRDAIGFFMDRLGNVAPHFFVQMPRRPALTVRIRQRFSSDAPQTITLNFRSPSDYTDVRGTKTVEVDEGESEVEYTVSAFPYVPPLVTEIQPENDRETILEEFVVV